MILVLKMIFFTFKIPLNNKEFAYSVDVSNVDCHCNAAAYFIDMPGWYFITLYTSLSYKMIIINSGIDLFRKQPWCW